MRRGKKKIFMTLEIIALVAVVVAMGSFGQILMKQGLTNLGGLKITEILSQRIVTVLTEWHVLAGVLLYAGSAILWLTILSKVDVSFAYPLIALGYIVTAILAKFYFNENITLIRWFGILLIIGGVFMVSRS